MEKYCSDCKYFNISLKKDNVVGICYCSKVKDYVFGNKECCEKFDESYGRSWYKREKIFDDGKKVSGEVSWGIPIVLIIILIFLKVLGCV